MKLLIIDTCGATGSVALAGINRQPPIVASVTLPGRTASERLVATIKDLTAQSGVSLQSLSAIAVVYGPGSFTGVRVGLSAAKGLCEALSLPLIAISRLEVLANLADPPPGVPVIALLDAGRGEFYSGIYAGGICLREAMVTRAELFAEIGSAATKTGGDAATQPTQAARLVVACEAAVARSIAELAPVLLAEPTAENALGLALLRLQARAFDDIATIDANYLRRTDAEIFAKPQAGNVAASHFAASHAESSPQ